MRFTPRRWLWLTCCLLAGAGIALAADRGDAQRYEYVITFDKVVVHNDTGTTETPAMAHIDLPTVAPREQPGAAPREPLSVGKPPPWADRKGDQAKGTERFEVPSPRVPWRAPEPQTSTPPGRGLANPTFVQEGFLVEAFWAVNTGSSDAYFKRAHFHPPDLSLQLFRYLYRSGINLRNRVPENQNLHTNKWRNASFIPLSPISRHGGSR